MFVGREAAIYLQHSSERMGCLYTHPTASFIPPNKNRVGANKKIVANSCFRAQVGCKSTSSIICENMFSSENFAELKRTKIIVNAILKERSGCSK
jgi:hypothetical protein